MPFTAALYLVSITFLCILIRCAFGPRSITGIPYNKFLWWLPTGSLVELAIHFYRTGEVFDWFSYQNARHGSPIVQLFLPSLSFTKPVITIADLKEIQDISTRRMHEIDRSDLVHGFFRLFAGHATIGLKTKPDMDATPGNVTFRQQRRLWNCMLTPRVIETIGAPALHRAVEKMLDLWDLKAQLAPDYAFEIDLDLRQTVLEGMFDMLTGDSLVLLEANSDSMRESTSEDISIDAKRGKVSFKKAARYPRLYQALSTIFVCLDWVTTGFSPQFYTWVFEYTWILSKANKVRDAILYGIIDDARSRISHQVDTPSYTSSSVLEEVLLRDSESVSAKEASLSNEALKDELMELLITGHETTAAATGWALKYLADNQAVQERLWQTLHAAFPEAGQRSLPGARELMKAELPYLDAVITETLRLSSTGPVSFRETIRDCEVLGHKLEVGTQIILITGGLSYNTSGDRTFMGSESMSTQTSPTNQCLEGKYHDMAWSPAAFVPDRWINAEGKFDKFAYPSLPFSAGPRGCFGKKIALLDMRLMIAMVVLRFKLPKLPPALSKYNSRDSLTRKPICCYAKPQGRVMA